MSKSIKNRPKTVFFGTFRDTSGQKKTLVPGHAHFPKSLSIAHAIDPPKTRFLGGQKRVKKKAKKPLVTLEDTQNRPKSRKSAKIGQNRPKIGQKSVKNRSKNRSKIGQKSVKNRSKCRQNLVKVQPKRYQKSVKNRSKIGQKLFNSCFKTLNERQRQTNIKTEGQTEPPLPNEDKFPIK